MGDGLSPRGGSLRPPHPEPRRRQRRQRQAAYNRGDARRGGAGARRVVDWGGAVATLAAATASVEPLRKRKRGFSILR
jgi:hypothetical protein